MAFRAGEIPMRVLVCGGRDFARFSPFRVPSHEGSEDEYKFLIGKLSELLHPYDPTDVDGSKGTWLPPSHLTIIAGGAFGADSAAIDWAVVNWVNFEEYPADWDTHGKAAGPIRNQQMLDTGIDKVIAFPGGRGTAHMVEIARKAGVEVIEVPYEKRT